MLLPPLWSGPVNQLKCFYPAPPTCWVRQTCWCTSTCQHSPNQIAFSLHFGAKIFVNQSVLAWLPPPPWQMTALLQNKRLVCKQNWQKRKQFSAKDVIAAIIHKENLVIKASEVKGNSMKSPEVNARFTQGKLYRHMETSPMLLQHCLADVRSLERFMQSHIHGKMKREYCPQNQSQGGKKEWREDKTPHHSQNHSMPAT